MKWLQRLLVALGAVSTLAVGTVLADYLVTQGSGTTIFAFTCFTTKVCPPHVPINSAGTEIFTSGAPGQVTGANGTFPAAGTVAAGAADSGNPVKVGGKYNSSPVTLTDGNRGDAQLDVNGYLKINMAACASATCNANGQAAMASSAPVVIASNQTAADPCMFQNKTSIPFAQNGTASTQLIALSGGTTIYVCSLSIIAAGATTWALTTGTGSACASGTAAVMGSTTVANSLSFAANGGLTLGNGGNTIAKGAAASALCHINGTNVYVSGNLTYVQQ